jgi:hypothetical protein
MSKRILIMVVLIAFLSSFYGISFESVEAAPEMETYSNDEWGYSIEYPKGWDLNEGSYVVFTAPIEDGVYTNVNVMLEKLSKSMSLEEYFSKAKEGFETTYDDFEIVDKSNTTINNEVCMIVEYLLNNDGREIKIKQAILIKEKTVYVITCASTPDKYNDDDREYFDPMIKSFKIIEKDSDDATDQFFLPFIIGLAAGVIIVILIIIFIRRGRTAYYDPPPPPGDEPRVRHIYPMDGEDRYDRERPLPPPPPPPPPPNWR